MLRRVLLACCLLPGLLVAEQILIPRYREAERGVAEGMARELARWRAMFP